MSGIINRVIKHKKEAVVLLLILGIVIILLTFRMYIPILIIIVLAVANEFTVRKINRQKAPFGTYSKIRNVDCLVIGDVSQKSVQALSDCDTAVSIFLPDCTLAGAYEVLRHTFSILKENGGRVMLVVGKKNLKRVSYTPFEISFFHTTTINRLKINRVKYILRLPIIFAPIKSLIFLLGIFRAKSVDEYSDVDISAFCEERGFDGKIFVR